MAMGLMRLLGSFFRNDSGGIAALIGFMIVPLIGFVGLAVDTSRIYITQSRLQFAIDAAGLAAAKAYQETTGDAAARKTAATTAANAYFAANMDVDTNAATTAAALSDLDEGPLRVLDSGKRFQMEASITIPTTFIRVLAALPMGQSLAPDQEVTIRVDTEVTRAQNKQEIVLALDNTGSMWERPSGQSQTRMELMRTAAKDLVTTVMNGSEDGYVRIGVVPFATSVNIKSEAPLSDDPDATVAMSGARTLYTDSDRLNNLYDRCPGTMLYCTRPTGTPQTYASVTALRSDYAPLTGANAWNGCIEDSPSDPRMSGNCSVSCNASGCSTNGCAITNAVNDTYVQRFFPYLYATTIGRNDSFQISNSSNTCAPASTNTDRRNDYIPSTNSTFNCKNSSGTTIAPVACVSDAYARTASASINLNRGYGNWTGGSQPFCTTNSNPRVGLATASQNYDDTHGPNTNCPFAMLALSGNAGQVLRALDAMGAGNGVGTHNDVGARWALRMLSPNWQGFFGSPSGTDGWPKAFNDSTVDKRVILLTDGQNVTAHYGSHGYGSLHPSDGRVDTTAELDALMLSACNALKSTTYDVEVYTVLVDVNSTYFENLFKACASDGKDYNIKGTELSAVFAEIAADLLTLRLSN